MTKSPIFILIGGAMIGCLMLTVPLEAQESNCPDPVFICEYYHPTSVFTAGCEGPACFSKSYGEAVMVVATDDRGFFTTVWNLWAVGEVDTDIPGYPCDVVENGSKDNDNKLYYKYKLTKPERYLFPGCRVEVHQEEFIFHEHFVANPDTGCLGWAECRLFVGVGVGTTELANTFVPTDTDDMAGDRSE